MAEVMFEWADGPCANAAFQRMSVFDPVGEKIFPRTETIKFHKNGKWSYSDLRVFVPEGSIIVQMSGNTHGHLTKRIWLASTGRPEVFRVYGKWQQFPTWPTLESDSISAEVFRKVLCQVVAQSVQDAWEANQSIQAI